MQTSFTALDSLFCLLALSDITGDRQHNNFLVFIAHRNQVFFVDPSGAAISQPRVLEQLGFPVVQSGFDLAAKQIH